MSLHYQAFIPFSVQSWWIQCQGPDHYLVLALIGKLYGIVQRVSVFVSGFGEDQVKGLGVTQGAGGEI